MIHLQIPTRLLARHVTRSRRCYSSSRNPLRVLLCGSDEFSIAGLRALHNLHQSTNDPSVFASIDVVCRPGKRTGRGLKTIREVPIKRVAEELLLPVHEIDTFTGWNPPPCSLIVAVSFGLFVPPRIIRAAEHGGINVHPSLLPDLRGPAPLMHALLAGYKYTGITIQTLGETGFDKGQILAQTPLPGVKIPERCTYSELLDLVQQPAADMLYKYIRDKYAESGGRHKESQPSVKALSPQSELRHAPKITPAEREIDWETWTAQDMICRERILGRLWSDIHLQGKSRRVILEDFELLPNLGADNTATPIETSCSPKSRQSDFPATDANQPQSERYTISSLPVQNYADGDSLMVVMSPDKQAVRIKSATIEGSRKKCASSLCYLKQAGETKI